MASNWLSCSSIFRTIPLVVMAAVAIATVLGRWYSGHWSSLLAAIQTTDVPGWDRNNAS